MRGLARSWTCVVALAVLSACRQPNPEWLGPAVDDGAVSDTTDTGIADGTSEGGVDSTNGGSTTTEPSPLQCAPDPVLGEGECPAPCSSCEGGRCLVDCIEVDCESSTIECPAGWPCDFACTGSTACKRGKLRCAPDRDCTVDCQGEGACQAAKVTCGAGTCTVTCGTQKDACRSIDLECGPADSTITCASPEGVDVHASDGSPCACEAIGCDG